MALQTSPCFECGTQINRDTGFGMTVSPAGQEDLELLFCRQDHAAAWLAKPLPLAVPELPVTRGDLAIMLLVLALLGLAVIGAIALSTGQDVNPF